MVCKKMHKLGTQALQLDCPNANLLSIVTHISCLVYKKEFLKPEASSLSYYENK